MRLENIMQKTHSFIKPLLLMICLFMSTTIYAQLNVFICGDGLYSAATPSFQETVDVVTSFPLSPNVVLADTLNPNTLAASGYTQTGLAFANLFDCIIFLGNGRNANPIYYAIPDAFTDDLIDYVVGGGNLYTNLENFAFNSINNNRIGINAAWNDAFHRNNVLKDSDFNLLMSETILGFDDDIIFSPVIRERELMRHGKYFFSSQTVLEHFLSLPNDLSSVLFTGIAAGSIIDPPEGTIIGTSPSGLHDYALFFNGDTHFNMAGAGYVYMNSDINIYGSYGDGFSLIENFINLIEQDVSIGEQPMIFGQ